MKKNIVLSLLFAGILFLATSCSLFDLFDHASKEPEKVELTKKAAEIIKADQLFAFELFHQVCSLSQAENIMISPLSVSYALGMTYNGAAGTTLDAFNEVLHFDSLTKTEVNESYQDLMGQLISLDDQIEFSIANSIWHAEWADVKQEFIDLNKTYFDASVAGLDLSDQSSVDIINDWISDKTGGKIQDMLDFIPPNVYMYLINAVYFNAEWKYRFDKSATAEGDFFQEDGSSATAEFMSLEADLNFLNTDDYSAVELPYGDGAYSMVVMMPAYDKGISDLLDSFDKDMWDAYCAGAAPAAVGVIMPKFTFSFKDSLNLALKQMGLEVAFSPDADFSGMTEQLALYISRVIHQTFINVDEEGTEAGAATIVEMSYKSGNIVFQADRPFLFVIKENSTGAIMFMGKVGRPVFE